MKNITLTILAISSITLIFSQCSNSAKPVSVEIDEPPYVRLSQYHFFKGKLADLSPNDGVVPYDLNSPLFTDYAHKARFVWMPEGISATYKTGEVFDFPLETVLIKNFYYKNDENDPTAGKRIIETRLLIHRDKGWEAHSYVWNDKQTEATLDIVGDIIPVSWKNKDGKTMQANYIIPNKNQCKGCHSYDQKIMPIGPKARNLNKTYSYADSEENQLTKWQSIGYLKGLKNINQSPKAAQWDNPSDALHQRAMAYLDINCGHCHNPHGPGGTTGLNLVYGAPLDLNVGINKAPVATGRASGGHRYSIVKGEPENSIMTFRIASDEPGVMMPELGRTLVHKEGLALITEWIAAME